MEIESPDNSTSCCEQCRISPEIEGLDIIISRCTELVNLPDTDDNQEMKAILRASIDAALKKKDALVSELRSLPQCTTFNCQVKWSFPYRKHGTVNRRIMIPIVNKLYFENDYLMMEIHAPFFNDPPSPSDKKGPFPKMWDYEGE
ncbi:hypothetical protein TNIN_416401 [Trichonephila inaurata madagascariensis]|uniref:Uncharacterized protein n=1 Tax=Trichonephila inaurata madagascariensis TaxID=2747483 RepID=A0A8X6XBQ8_9ARAC|nr:hypothetical protein TNIN_416401 [Trichonephila inaurata madagascariensis]